jgi:glycosyltransferase involved in cell wall biosynthesis
MFRPDGVRRAHITPDMLDGTAFAFTPNDVLVCAGAGWAHHNIDVVHRLKQTTGVRVVILCYDIIPLLHPHFYRSHDVEAFRDYFRRAFPLADLVIFTSRKVEADVRSYCHLHGIALGSTLVSPVGANACTIPSTPVNLPEGLKQERYILLVSTIEPRKGHRMIYGIWCRLLREGIPQQADYKLVFVGRRGWMVDDLIRQITENSHVANSLVVLNDVDDAALAVLYRGAAFALYPSLYEGFGLPVVEAFFHGKAILASSGGALPEAVGEFSPCLDPKDAELWYRTLKRWIVDPAARAPFEALIRSGFRHPTWSEAAQAFFTAIDRSLPAKPDWHARQSELDRPTMRR